MKRADFNIDRVKVGDECSNNILVTADLLDHFITVSGDSSLIHLDSKYARNAGFDDRVVHGALISSFFSALIGTQLPGNSGLLLEISCKFHTPAFVNNTIFVKATITDIHKNIGCISIRLQAEDDNAKKLSTGKALVKIRA